MADYTTQGAQTPAKSESERWKAELEAAKKWRQPYLDEGLKIEKRFRNEREQRRKGDKRLALFSSNVQTQRAMVFGEIPKATISRRFGDAKDDIARVASEMLERMCNTDLEQDGDSACEALDNALLDRMVPGLGVARVRLEAEFQMVQAQQAVTAPDPMTGAQVEVQAAVEAHEAVVPGSEEVEIDYLRWEDCLWSPCRNWAQMRWFAHRNEMSRGELVERFGDDIGNKVPLNVKRDRTKKEERAGESILDRAEVWEIWCKDDSGEHVYWYNEDTTGLLDSKEDPYGLRGFWPFERPMVANRTTSTTLPVPDFRFSEDQYDNVDVLESRIALLGDALKVRGVYAKTNQELKRLLSEDVKNELLPVDNWAMFAEKGGIKGAVDWFPIDMVAGVLMQLRDIQAEAISKTQMMSGIADIMRGQATTPGVTAREQSIKANFGSVRLRALQKEFARFATGLIRRKAELIANHFSKETIIERSNVLFTADAKYADAAVELIKSRFAMFRIDVKPDSVSIEDMAKSQAQATEFLGAVSSYAQAMAPIATAMPNAMPYMLRLLQAGVAGYPFADQAETILDEAIEDAQKAAQQPQQQKPDPKAQAEASKVIQLQLKGQQELAKVEAEKNADLTLLVAETEAKRQQEINQAQANDWERQQQDMRTAQMPKPQAAPRR